MLRPHCWEIVRESTRAEVWVKAVAVHMRREDELCRVGECDRVRQVPLHILAPIAAIVTAGASGVPAVAANTLHKDQPMDPMTFRL